MAAVLATSLASGDDAAGHARDLLRCHEARTGRRGVVVGAVPFDPSMPAWLYVPERFEHVAASGDAQHLGHGTRDSGGLDQPDLTVPRDPAYLESVAVALDLIDRGPFEKVVLARAVDVVADGKIDLSLLQSVLARRNPSAYTFSVDLPGAGVLTGASPELLVRVTDGALVSNPLAGSARRGVSAEADALVRDRLLGSAKDLAEHNLVVDGVRRALTGLTVDLDVPGEPSLSSTPQLWHLSTTVRGRTASDVSSLDAAYALHPTPAVGGVPGPPAQDLIQQLEAVDRGFYAGLVGWMDADGDGEWVLALRCGLVQGRRVRVHAGAGLVAGSIPESEHAETGTKLQTFLGALAEAVSGEASVTVAGELGDRDRDRIGVTA